jgi:NADH-quinone oxidoreductase subunit I
MGEVPGRGLTKALAQTFRRMTKPAVTTQYPDVQPDLPPRSRGVIALIEENCTVCMLCARECPDWCIYIDSHKEEQPPTTPGGRPRQRNVLDRFAIDFSLCMYCGICVEVCPFDALFWSPEFEYSEFDIRDLTHEKDRLREWMWTVPPPPAHDEHAADPKEIEAASKPAPRKGAEAGKPETGTKPVPRQAAEAGKQAGTEPVARKAAASKPDAATKAAPREAAKKATQPPKPAGEDPKPPGATG